MASRTLNKDEESDQHRKKKWDSELNKASQKHKQEPVGCSGVNFRAKRTPFFTINVRPCT